SGSYCPGLHNFITKLIAVMLAQVGYRASKIGIQCKKPQATYMAQVCQARRLQRYPWLGAKYQPQFDFHQGQYRIKAEFNGCGMQLARAIAVALAVFIALAHNLSLQLRI